MRICTRCQRGYDPQDKLRHQVITGHWPTAPDDVAQPCPFGEPGCTDPSHAEIARIQRES